MYNTSIAKKKIQSVINHQNQSASTRFCVEYQHCCQTILLCVYHNTRKGVTIVYRMNNNLTRCHPRLSHETRVLSAAGSGG